MGEDYDTLLDAVMPPTGESFPPYLPNEEGQEKLVSPTRNGPANGAVPGFTPTVETHSIPSEEATENPLQTKSESLDEALRAPDVPEETLNQENNGLENSSTLPAAVHVPGEVFSEIPTQEVEHDAVVQPHEPTQQEEEAPVEAPVVIVEEPLDSAMQGTDEAPDLINEQGDDPATQGADETPVVIVEMQEEVQVQEVMDVVQQDEIPATSGDEQQQKPQEVAIPPGGDLVKQEVAHRSHVLGSLSKLDENSARQLLKDYGWNVSQSVRMNGKAQWYYRSPPPKPVLVGSLPSAVALWKKLVDDDHKRKGGGDDDLYPMVTAFLNNMKRPSAKKRKRGRYSE